MDVETLRREYRALEPELTERSRRLGAATDARELGHGGIALVEEATGVSRSTITRGIRELESEEVLEPGRARRPGGGRKKATEKDPTLLADLESLVEPTASGDPDSPLRWTSKSVRRLADDLTSMGHEVSHMLAADLLRELGYSLQANLKTREGPQHPDRDGQFRYITAAVRRFQKRAQPRSRWTRRRRSWSGTSRTQAANGGRSEAPNGSEYTTS